MEGLTAEQRDRHINCTLQIRYGISFVTRSFRNRWLAMIMNKKKRK